MAAMEEPQITNPGTSITPYKVLMMMSDYGHDPTETAVPYAAFRDAGYHVQFATESGKVPRCDDKMLKGITQKLLGAKKQTVQLYQEMSQSDEMRNPVSWSSPDFTLDAYDLVVFPGGHDKGVRQVIESPIVHRLVVDYFPKTKRPSRKAIAAVCHGVMALSESKGPDGKSVLHDCVTTALPNGFESGIYWGTRAFLGDYYKTYGHGSENVEESVTKALASPSQFKSSMTYTPFVVEDENYNYISARFPGDCDAFAEEIVKLMESFNKISW